VSKGAGVNQGDAGFEVEGTVLGLNHVNWRKAEKEIKGEGSRVSEKWVEMSIAVLDGVEILKMSCLVQLFPKQQHSFLYCRYVFEDFHSLKEAYPHLVGKVF
jgi:hypothetical protein